MSCVYVIVPTAQVTEEMWEVVVQTAETARKSVDGTQTLLKYEGPHPSCFDPYPKYNHPTILTVLATPAWTPVEV